VLSPLRRPYDIDGELVLFGQLDRAKTVPGALAERIRRALAQASLDPRGQDSVEPVFPLKPIRARAWTNSEVGARILARHDGPLVVLDALSLEDIEALRGRGGPFVFLGDRAGFATCEAASSDGRIPCQRCLTLRYLSGRRATARLHRALQLGYRVALEHPGLDVALALSERFATFGELQQTVDEVLPLPDCAECLVRSTVNSVEPGLFSPVVKHVHLGYRHAAHLPEMLWLCCQDTVGGGGSYEEDEALGRRKAIHEAYERYAAHFTPANATPEGIPFQSDAGPRIFSRRRALLTEPGSVSTGLACRESLPDAIDDALAELCERDALARFWLALGSGDVRIRPLEERVESLPDDPSTERITLKLYQLDSYYRPTVLCVGTTESGNVAVGSSCGSLAAALQKARAECLQNAAYLRAYCQDPLDPPESFEDHTGLYWSKLRKFPELQPFERIAVLVNPLPGRIYHADLTPPDLRLLHVHAVRVQVPGLLHLPMSHADWSIILEEAEWKGPPPSLPHPFS
jgi:hypothetical protein